MIRLLLVLCLLLTTALAPTAYAAGDKLEEKWKYIERTTYKGYLYEIVQDLGTSELFFRKTDKKQKDWIYQESIGSYTGAVSGNIFLNKKQAVLSLTDEWDWTMLVLDEKTGKTEKRKDVHASLQKKAEKKRGKPVPKPGKPGKPGKTTGEEAGNGRTGENGDAVGRNDASAASHVITTSRTASIASNESQTSSTVNTTVPTASATSTTAETPEYENVTTFTVTRMTPTSITLKWNKVVGAASYVVEVSSDDNDQISTMEMTTDTTITMPLPTGKVSLPMWDVGIITVFDEEKMTASDDWKFLFALTPERTATITMENKPTSIGLNWAPLDGVEKYNVNYLSTHPPTGRYDYGKEVQSFPTLPVSETKALLLDLKPSTWYGITIDTNNAETETSSEESQDIFAWISPTHPAPPEKPNEDTLYAEMDSSESAEFSWDLVKDATEYLVYNGDELLGSTGTFGDHFVMENIVAGETYDLYVAARNITGTSPRAHLEYFAGDEEFIPDMPDPPAPTGELPAPTGFEVIKEKIKQTTAELKWNAVEGAKGYVLWINGEKNLSIPAGATTYTLTNLEKDKPYELHLRALDEAGKDGASAIATFRTLPDPPEAPDIVLDKVTSITAYLTWEPAKRARAYVIQYGEGESPLQKTFKKANVKIKGLVEEKTYVFTIYAENRGGKSKPVIVTVRTIPLTFEYIYAGTLLDRIKSSYEQEWVYTYDTNGNTKQVTYRKEPKPSPQEFDITKPGEEALEESSDQPFNVPAS
ncbi:fibronectin type III domain-containing protein [Brevibacillus dissolubilis]|uniref:fibronectin type III domain-containing protein n=1 Tax=Brevibacillus dissolubilis TaxID=1844116 RepID=UPI001116081E|nr:fibronectin type III domain-containing protein [Brevibacillus dissolubilis]